MVENPSIIAVVMKEIKEGHRIGHSNLYLFFQSDDVAVYQFPFVPDSIYDKMWNI